MGKPDNIPQDVWDAAETAWETTAGGPDQRLAPMAAVRAAVLAEREACASIATAQRDNPFNDAGRHLAGRIAIAIRKRGEG